MAEVFRAQMPGAAGFTKAVAIKRVKPALATDPRVCEAFLQEAEVARRMHHGAVVQVYDVGVEDGVPYLVIELVDGMSLDALLTGLTRMPEHALEVADALYLIEHVAAALHHAHRLTDATGNPTPVVHRDVNPRNILISRDGVVKLTDFGIAKAWHLPSITLPGTVKGTLGYLSPEQAEAAPVDAASDQFSTGVVLYELLAGENPLVGAGSLHAYIARLAEGLPRLNAPAPVDDAMSEIVARAVAVDPGERYPSIEDLRAELEAWRVARGLRASPEGLARRVRAVLAAATTGAAPAAAPARALGAAIAAQLAAQPRAMTAQPGAAPAAPGPPRRRRLTLVAAAAAAAVLAVLAFLLVPDRASDANAGAGQEPAPAAAAGADDSTAAAPSPPQAATPAPTTMGADDPAGSGGARAPAASEDPSPAPGEGPGQARDRAHTVDPGRPTPPAPAHDHAGPGAGDGGRDRPRPATAGDRGQGERPGHSDRPGRTRAAPAGPPGQIKINLVPYALVSVDGDPRGQTPLALDLPPGEHTLELHNPDTGQRDRRRVTLGAGQTLTINKW